MAVKLRVPWLSIVLSGLLVFVISLAVTAAIVAGYAVTITVQAEGAPDPEKISAFANSVIPYVGPLLLSLLVVFAARRVVRRARSPQLWYGVLVGVVAALLPLIFMGRPGLGDVVGLVLPTASGWLGAFWAMNRLKRGAAVI
jgi:hypothetical protein